MPAKPNQIKVEITLEIDSGTISPEKFSRGVCAFFGLLNSVTHAIGGADNTIKWNVLVLPGSALVGVVPPSANVDLGLVEAAKATLGTAVDTLENRCGTSTTWCPW